MSEVKLLDRTVEVQKILKKLGGNSGLTSLNARELANFRKGVAFVMGDDSRGADAYVTICPEHGQYIVTINTLSKESEEKRCVVAADFLREYIWDFLVDLVLE
jgi:hypothetical protein